jgi:hypothetical protein
MQSTETVQTSPSISNSSTLTEEQRKLARKNRILGTSKDRLKYVSGVIDQDELKKVQEEASVKPEPSKPRPAAAIIKPEEAQAIKKWNSIAHTGRKVVFTIGFILYFFTMCAVHDNQQPFFTLSGVSYIWWLLYIASSAPAFFLQQKQDISIPSLNSTIFWVEFGAMIVAVMGSVAFYLLDGIRLYFVNIFVVSLVVNLLYQEGLLLIIFAVTLGLEHYCQKSTFIASKKRALLSLLVVVLSFKQQCNIGPVDYFCLRPSSWQLICLAKWAAVSAVLSQKIIAYFNTPAEKKDQ